MKKFIYAAALLALAGGCKKDSNSGGNNGSGTNEIVYLETNDFNGNANAILAYRHTGDGLLTPITGSPFSTGGSGVSNPTQKLGPDDSDQELALSSDHKHLLAVNGGSNNISVFNVAADGSLSAVAGSPFSSGGETPCSIYLNGSIVYVVNKSDNPAMPSVALPNYVTFSMDANGALTMISGAKFETTLGSSPAQILLSNDRKFAFGDDFLGFMTSPVIVGTLRSFTTDVNGLLTPVAGTPQVIPAMGGALGLWQHPTSNTLYVGFPLDKKIGVYGINATTGELSYQTSVAAGAAACWLRTNTAGSRLYCLNSGESTIGVYNSTAASSPVFMDTITLKMKGPSYVTPTGLALTTSEPFAFALSPDQDFMYVVSQHTNADFSIGNYNYVHVLKIDTDGKLSEPAEPVQIPVPSTVRPKGCVVYKIS